MGLLLFNIKLHCAVQLLDLPRETPSSNPCCPTDRSIRYVFLRPDGVAPHSPQAASPQAEGGKYRNVTLEQQGNGGFFKTLGLAWKFAFDKPKHTVPEGDIPVQIVARAQLLAAQDGTVFRMGHSTIL